MTSDSVIQYQCESIQKAAVNTLCEEGPGAIVHPQSSYAMCVYVGLIPSDCLNSSGGLTTVSYYLTFDNWYQNSFILLCFLILGHFSERYKILLL